MPSWKRRLAGLTWEHPLLMGLAIGGLVGASLGLRTGEWSAVTLVVVVVAAATFSAWFLVRRRRHPSPEALVERLEENERHSRSPQGRRQAVLIYGGLMLFCLAVLAWIAATN